MSNFKKFESLVNGRDTQSVKDARLRKANREMLKASSSIALMVLERLDELGMKQKGFAENMGVSPQYISKFLKGRENITLSTIIQLQSVLGISILSTNKEDKNIRRFSSVYSPESYKSKRTTMIVALKTKRIDLDYIEEKESYNSTLGERECIIGVG